jgi:hypothetical protein
MKADIHAVNAAARYVPYNEKITFDAKTAQVAVQAG